MTLRLSGAALAAVTLLPFLSPAAHADGIAATPTALAVGATGQTVTLTGTGSHWDAQTKFTISGGIGARIAAQAITDAEHATLTLSSGAQSGPSLLTIADSSDALSTTLNVTAPTVTSQVVCHGDSLTAGENASSGLRTATGTTYPGVLAAALGPTWQVSNQGTGGWTVEQMIREAHDRVDSLFRPELANNVLIVFGGTNNIGGEREKAEAVYAKLTAYCAARHKAHPWRILVVTAPVAAYPRVYPATFDAEMLRYDAMIRANWNTFADGLIDVQSDSRLGIPGDEFNPTYFNAHDFTHLTDTGYAIVGNYAAQAVFALVDKNGGSKP